MVFSVGALLQVNIHAVLPTRSTISNSLIMLWYLCPRRLLPPHHCLNRPPIARNAPFWNVTVRWLDRIGDGGYISLKASGYEVGRCRIRTPFSSSRMLSNCAAP